MRVTHGPKICIKVKHGNLLNSEFKPFPFEQNKKFQEISYEFCSLVANLNI